MNHLQQFLCATALPQTLLAARIGIDKGNLSRIVKSGACGPDIALKIEAATAGAVPAGALSRVVAESRRSAAVLMLKDEVGHTADDSAAVVPPSCGETHDFTAPAGGAAAGPFSEQEKKA